MKAVTICKNKQTRTIAVNRDVLGTLLPFLVKNGKIVDFEKALQSPIPLSLCNAGGAKRSNTKSQLSKMIVDRRSTEIPPQILKEYTFYELVKIALLHTYFTLTSHLLHTYFTLTSHLLHTY